MERSKRFFWVGILVATWQFLGCSKISEQIEPATFSMGTVADQATHRKVYQLSVIPGGVYSGAELARARRTDPVVAIHYADFDLNAHVEHLPQDELVYVSYRRADKVFWTRKKHRVCQGEAVIRDGKNNLARARCGNRLSKTPKYPIALHEPAQNALDTPQIPAGPVETGAGPLDAENLPPVNPFNGDGLPHSQLGPGQTGTGTTPVTTGAGGETPFPAQNFSPIISPYYGGGPLVAPVVGTTTTGGGSPTGGGTTVPGGGTTSTGGTTTTGTGTTPVTITPEPSVVWLVTAGGLLIVIFRLRRTNDRPAYSNQS